MSEIIFEVREAEEGGLWARALGHSIFTQGEDWNDLRTMVKDAVTCHFKKETERPESHPLALRPGRSPRFVKIPRDCNALNWSARSGGWDTKRSGRPARIFN